MAYIALTAAETASGAPVKQTLWRKVRDNFDYLLSGIATSGVSSVVLNGSFEIDSDSDGIPDTWTRYLYPGGASELNASGVLHGSKGVALVHPGGAGNGGGYFQSDYVMVHQLHPRWVGWLMYSSAAGIKNQVLVGAYDKDKIFLGFSTIYSSTANPIVPTYFIRPYTPPENCRFIKISVLGGNSDTDVAGWTRFDDVSVNPWLEGFGAFSITEQSTVSATFVDAGSATITLPNMGTILLNIAFTAAMKTGGAGTVYQRFRIGGYYSNETAYADGVGAYAAFSYSLAALVDSATTVTIYQQLYYAGGSIAYGKKDVSQSVCRFSY